MKSTLRQSLMAAAVAAALGASGAATAAIGFNFAPGGGLGTPVDEFDWGNNPVLAYSSFSGASSTVLGATLYGQGSMDQAKLNGIGVGATSAQMQNFTFVFSLPVFAQKNPTGATGSANLDQVVWAQSLVNPDYGPNNYFRLYYNLGPGSPAFNTTTGTGYQPPPSGAGTGLTLILTGHLTINTSGANYTTLTPGLVALGTGSTISTVQGTGGINVNVNVCNAGETDAFGCTGGPADVQDTNFFRTNISGLTIDAILADNFNIPFGGSPIPASVVGQTPIYGASPFVNDFNCNGGTVGAGTARTSSDQDLITPGLQTIAVCDMLYNGTNGKMLIQDNTFVPEPGSLALLGLGLAGLGFSARRKLRSA